MKCIATLTRICISIDHAEEDEENEYKYCERKFTDQYSPSVTNFELIWKWNDIFDEKPKKGCISWKKNIVLCNIEINSTLLYTGVNLYMIIII